MRSSTTRLGECVLITSALSGTGQTYVCAHLGLALAQAGCKVALLGSDGLMSALNGPETTVRYVQEDTPSAYRVTSPSCPNLVLISQSPSNSASLHSLQEEFDYLLLDLSLNEAAPLKERIHRTLLVCSASPHAVCEADQLLSALESTFDHEPELLINAYPQSCSSDEQAHILEILAIPLAGLVPNSQQRLLRFFPSLSPKPYVGLSKIVAYLRNRDSDASSRENGAWEKQRDRA